MHALPEMRGSAPSVSLGKAGWAYLAADRDSDNFVLYRELPALGRLIFQAEFDGLSDVLESLGTRTSLADTARDRWAFGYQEAIFPCSQDNREIHE